jgi:hypothetical protein
MDTLRTEVCFLSAQEARGWEIHSKPPTRCDKSLHKHVTQGEARKMCRAGEARLAYIRGRWCLMPQNPKRGYEVRSSAGYVVLQLVAD